MLLGGVILVVGAPLRAARARRRSGSGGSAHGGSATAAAGAPGAPPEQGSRWDRDELEAAREAKYREIRDVELDFHTGKLAREDFDTIDRELRAEALEILNRLQQSADPAPTDADEPGDAGGHGDAAAPRDAAAPGEAARDDAAG